ncbi:MAG: hypothetical protein IPP97_19840 [Candidatus Obscuribacter sp.]|nr:hypothetical protein [Candidatus Obscuribacter sp.]
MFTQIIAANKLRATWLACTVAIISASAPAFAQGANNFESAFGQNGGQSQQPGNFNTQPSGNFGNQPDFGNGFSQTPGGDFGSPTGGTNSQPPAYAGSGTSYGAIRSNDPSLIDWDNLTPFGKERRETGVGKMGTTINFPKDAAYIPTEGYDQIRSSNNSNNNNNNSSSSNFPTSNPPTLVVAVAAAAPMG